MFPEGLVWIASDNGRSSVGTIVIFGSALATLRCASLIILHPRSASGRPRTRLSWTVKTGSCGFFKAFLQEATASVNLVA